MERWGAQGGARWKEGKSGRSAVGGSTGTEDHGQCREPSETRKGLYSFFFEIFFCFIHLHEDSGVGWGVVNVLFVSRLFTLQIRTVFCSFQVVQQLVEERLRVLQLTVFDHSLQELKDRVEKIDAATKQQKTVQHTLQVSPDPCVLSLL